MILKRIPVVILFLMIAMLSVSSVVTAQDKQVKKIEIEANFPGGNIQVHQIKQDTVYLHQNLRDTEGNWFYWSFRIKGAANKTIHFKFIHPWKDLPKMPVIAANGPAISHDERKSWKWLSNIPYTNDSFTYTFSSKENLVYFSMGMNYTEVNLQTFLNDFSHHPDLEIGTLAQTREGRLVEKIHIGNLRSTPKFRIVMTARHHACEMMGSYVLEGIMKELLSNSQEAVWLRENVEFLIIPFVDKDGVENGDQGKNRRGRDHNRDYSGESIYASTRGLRSFVPVWATGIPLIGIDLHCPFISGGDTNERIYLVGGRDLMLANAENKFAAYLENRTSASLGLRYAVKDNVPFGTSWNVGGNYTKGFSFREWISSQPNIKLATTFEVPYAIASGRQVNQESAREFGKNIARSLFDNLHQ